MIEKAKKRIKTKRKIGYIGSAVVCVWCTFSVYMFSQEFGHNTSQIWLLNFGITSLIDIIVTDVLVAFAGVLFVLYFPKLKQ